MKKTYQNPTTVIVSLSVNKMIAGSGKGGILDPNDPTKKNLDLSDTGTTEATSGNLSRRRSEWDDEEEEW